MKTVTSDALRVSLDRVDRERKVSKTLAYCMLAFTLGMWVAMMFAKNDHVGLPYGLAAVIGAVYYAGMMAAKASHDNTRIILRAIETLSKESSDIA